jgi:hypothetical protein
MGGVERQRDTRIAFDAAVTTLALGKDTIALADALGRIHVFAAQQFLCYPTARTRV